jgi:hypothetical protein
LNWEETLRIGHVVACTEQAAKTRQGI